MLSMRNFKKQARVVPDCYALTRVVQLMESSRATAGTQVLTICGISRLRYVRSGVSCDESDTVRAGQGGVRGAPVDPHTAFTPLQGSWGGRGMNGFSVRSEFADYRAIGTGVAIMPTVSVVIPAKNEARNLEHVFATIPEWVHEIVLVDGHSVDDTVAVARRLYPAVNIVHQEGRGKGNALQAGFAAAKGEIVVMMDADGSTDGREIPRFVAALTTGADFAKGSRFASGGGSDDITFSRRFGNQILSGLVNNLFGTRYTDLCYGYNAFWAKHLTKLDLDCDGFEVETVMNVRAAKVGLSIQEIPSHEHSRLHGESNLKVIRDGIRIAKFIFRERFGSRTAEDTQALEETVTELSAISLAVPSGDPASPAVIH
jgi:Glycosyl transferase family 2